MEVVDQGNQDQSPLTANMSLAAIAANFLLPAGMWPSAWGGRANAHDVAYASRILPEKAQIIDQRAFNVLPEVLPPTEANATTVSLINLLALGLN